MFPIHTILHATDFSERSEYALEFACALSRDYSAQLVILHVDTWPTVGFKDGVVVLPDHKQSLNWARQKLNHLHLPDANIPVDLRVKQGDPATLIVQTAEECHADLIVIGAHGHSALGRLLMGSVTEEVLRKAQCPVLTVKTPIASAATEVGEEHLAHS
jgi:nucleotide-binding universal stress UspA family protein